MVVERWVVPAKPGLLEDVGAMLQGFRSTMADPTSMRIFSSEFGEMSRVSFEFAYESFAALEESWNEWNASTESAEFMGKWNKLVAAHGTRELWTVVE
jgi:hypothetical protein